MQTLLVLVVLLAAAAHSSHLPPALPAGQPAAPDCQQFGADLIHCFAHALFAQHSAHFADLPDLQSRPVITARFQSASVPPGANVTFTCQTQVDALPVFLFYRLSPGILQAYSDRSAQFHLADHAQPLQLLDSDLAGDYVPAVPRLTFERRAHVQDANQDALADMETLSLRISGAVAADSGYYLCIVANSQRAFRLTYALLEVSEGRWLWAPELTKVEAGLVVAAGLLLIFCAMLVRQCCCCCEAGARQKALIAKTVDSMKQVSLCRPC